MTEDNKQIIGVSLIMELVKWNLDNDLWKSRIAYIDLTDVLQACVIGIAEIKIDDFLEW